MSKKHHDERKLHAVGTYDDNGILGQGGYCNALRPDKTSRCRLKAGHGTDHVGYGACFFHGGNSPSLKRHAARVQVRELAAEMEMDPFEALALCVRLAAGATAFYRSKIEDLEGELLSPDEWTATEAAAKSLELSVWVEAYNDERDRLAKHAKLAIDAGIDARRIQIEEEKATLFADALRAILGELKLTAEQRKLAPNIVRKHLMAIDAKAQEAS